MNTTAQQFDYHRAHNPGDCSWYRETVWLDGVCVAEIREPTSSTTRRKIYEVCKYMPVEVLDGTVDLARAVAAFSTVSECKDYINNGGLNE